MLPGVSPERHGDIGARAPCVKRKFLGMDTKNIEFIDRDAFEKNAAPLKSRLVAMASSIGARFVDPLDFLWENRRCPHDRRSSRALFQAICF
jgi:hypothetical protein